MKSFFSEEDETLVDNLPTSDEHADLWKVRQIDETAATWAWRFPLSNLNKEEKVHLLRTFQSFAVPAAALLPGYSQATFFVVKVN